MGGRFGQVRQAKGEPLVSPMEQRAGPSSSLCLSSSSGPSSSSSSSSGPSSSSAPKDWLSQATSALKRFLALPSVALKRNCPLHREALVFSYFSLIGVFACHIWGAERVGLVQGFLRSFLSGRVGVGTRRVNSDWHRAGAGSCFAHSLERAANRKDKPWILWVFSFQ